MFDSITHVPDATSTSNASGFAGGKAWLAPHLKRGKTERFSFDALITPDIARAMLAFNVGNRPVTASRVAEHVKRLRNGSFILTHQGIAFSSGGVLNDGQHRLTAISEADIPARVNVTFGCNREEFSVVDQGKHRGVADLLAIRGMKYYAVAAAIANALYSVQFGRAGSVQEIEAYALGLNQNILAAASSVAQSMNKISNPSSTGAAFYWIATHSKQPSVMRKLEAFWHGMSAGENLTGCRLRLREWLLHRASTSRDSKLIATDRAAAIINTWNSWLVNRKTASFEWGLRNQLPGAN
jgi:hypothetical protein